MKNLTRRMYIEQKSNCVHDRGPAVIGEVTFSKSGKTIYYKNKSFKKCGHGGGPGNYYCVEDGEHYWISGVKKDGNNRHWAGGGPVVENGDLPAPNIYENACVVAEK